MCFTGKVFISTPRTPDRRTHRCNFNTARGPQDPLTTAVLDQVPPGRAAKRLAPPGRLKRVLDLRRMFFISVIFFRIPFASPTCAAAASCCVWCTKNDLALVLRLVLEVARSSTVNGAVARAPPLRPLREAPAEM